MGRLRLQVALAVTLVAAGIAFGLGSYAEHAQEPSSTPTAPSAGDGVVPNATAPEGSPQREAAERGQPAPTNNTTMSNADGELLFGVNTETPPFIAAGVALQVVLAVVVWRKDVQGVLMGVLGFGVVFAALDAREVVHQVSEQRLLIALVAVVVLALHGLVVGLAALAVRARRRGAAPT